MASHHTHNMKLNGGRHKRDKSIRTRICFLFRVRKSHQPRSRLIASSPNPVEFLVTSFVSKSSRKAVCVCWKKKKGRQKEGVSRASRHGHSLVAFGGRGLVVVAPATTAAVASIGAATIAAAIVAAAVATVSTVATIGLLLLLLITTAVASTVVTAATAETTTALVSITGLLVVSTAALETTIGTVGAVKGLVDTNDATIEFLIVHSGESGIGLSIRRKADEAETTAAQSCTILDDDSFLDLAELPESLAESVITGVPRKAVDKELRHDGGGCSAKV